MRALGRPTAVFVLSLGSIAVSCRSENLGFTPGDPCRPGVEKDPNFAGFSEQEIVLEQAAPDCAGQGVCLVNHFRGRVACPKGGSSCETTSHQPVSANVKAQCLDRPDYATVYCSCRCANIAGRTDDGASYCTCQDGFVCEQLVTSIGSANDGLSGAYCTKRGTTFDKSTACSQELH